MLQKTEPQLTARRYWAIPLRLTLATLGAVVSFATSSARAQRGTPPDATPELALSQYQHDRWTTADGMPNQAVDWIARSPDGYLWLGTEGGLVRFDGVRFIDRFDFTGTLITRKLAWSDMADRLRQMG